MHKFNLMLINLFIIAFILLVIYCVWQNNKIKYNNMDKNEPNFNMWGEISDSELVLEAAKVEQKIRKTTI